MLSYRHGFHAGNFADVLKHTALVAALGYLTAKAKPLVYIDTHAGAGRYALNAAPDGGGNREYAAGIGRLWRRDDLPPPLLTYRELVAACNGAGALRHYPGSPWLAQRLLRDDDRLLLYELHTGDEPLLRRALAPPGRERGRGPRVHAERADGLRGCLGALPPPERRGLVLFDPSYELKTDYRQVPETLLRAWRRFRTGVYLLWYPVVERRRVDALDRLLADSAVDRLHRYELAVTGDGARRGMTGCGLYVVNAPWTLYDRMRDALGYLRAALAEDGGAFFRAERLRGD